MSLRWFAFDADAYTGDTAHLTCEEHGAYLLLILAYYRSEKPLPATDRALSSITKLPMDRWLECKPTLAVFFSEETGTWRHDRIEKELVERHDRHEKWQARARAGGVAKQRKAVLEKSTTVLEALGEQPKDVPHLHSTLTKDSLSTRANDVLKEDDPPPPSVEPEQVISMPISREFKPSLAVIERLMGEADLSTIHLEIQKFIFHHLEEGSFSCDWQSSFEKWWLRFVEHHKKIAKPRAAPRIEVNTTTVDIDWDRQITRWLKNNSMWSHKLCGPEPGQAGCRVPLEKLQQFNIDPSTGLVITPQEKIA